MIELHLLPHQHLLPEVEVLGRNPIISQRRKLWFFGGTTETMKEIIGRGLGL